MPLGSDRTKRAYEQWAAQYDQDPNPQLVLEFEDVLRVVDPKPGEAILDAACGTGRYTVAFHTRGADVLGVDFSAGMVAQARRKNPALRFVIADLREPLPLVADTFDAVNCAQALKHLPSLRTPVTEFARVLKPGGRLVFSVTHPEMDWNGYELRDQPTFILSRESDIYPYRFADYCDTIAEASLQLEDIYHVPVSEKIAHLLTPESFRTVQGRHQVVIFRAMKAAT